MDEADHYIHATPRFTAFQWFEKAIQ